MKCVVGIDLGSTTTKAVLLDESGELLGRGITNSRSNYEAACAVAREEAHTAARFTMLERALGEIGANAACASQGAAEGAPRAAAASPGAATASRVAEPDLAALRDAFRLELHVAHLAELREAVERLLLTDLNAAANRATLSPAVAEVFQHMEAGAPALFAPRAERKSDFFRDLAGAAFVSAAEEIGRSGRAPFERLVGLFDRAILDVETRLVRRDFGRALRAAVARVAGAGGASGGGPGGVPEATLRRVADHVTGEEIEELAFVGTGYGRQTLPFPKEAVRSEILCHGRGAHRLFPRTRTVLDIGGQDTKAIQVDEAGVVTSFQMNDRCAAGCGRYLGYIADELSLGLHELGPLALQAQRVTRVNSTCTVFAGAELRERLALGQRREDILAGLHRSMMLRAVSLLARSGGVKQEFTFTGGVCKNPMAVRVLRDLVDENYDRGITLNVHPDSIYMGAIGAALFGRDDLLAGRPRVLPTFAA